MATGISYLVISMFERIESKTKQCIIIYKEISIANRVQHNIMINYTVVVFLTFLIEYVT